MKQWKRDLFLVIKLLPMFWIIIWCVFTFMSFLDINTKMAIDRQEKFNNAIIYYLYHS